MTEEAALSTLQSAASKLGDAATPASDLARSLVGDSATEYQNLLEQGWQQNVLQK